MTYCTVQLFAWRCDVLFGMWLPQKIVSQQHQQQQEQQQQQQKQQQQHRFANWFMAYLLFVLDKKLFSRWGIVHGRLIYEIGDMKNVPQKPTLCVKLGQADHA